MRAAQQFGLDFVQRSEVAGEDAIVEGELIGQREAGLVEQRAHDAGVRELEARREAEALQRLAGEEDELDVAAGVGVAEELDAALPVLAPGVALLEAEDVLDVEEAGGVAVRPSAR